MRIIKIDKKQYELPESWKDIKISRLKKIQNYLSTEHKQSVSELTAAVSVFIGVPANEVTNWPVDFLLAVYSDCVQFMSLSSDVNTDTLVLKSGTYPKRQIETFTTKEFIDYDTLAVDATSNISLLLALEYFPGAGEDEYVDSIKKFADEIENEVDAEFALSSLKSFSEALLKFVISSEVFSSPAALKEMEKNPKLKSQIATLKSLIDGDGN